jgi:hypothetical protein
MTFIINRCIPFIRLSMKTKHLSVILGLISLLSQSAIMATPVKAQLWNGAQEMIPCDLRWNSEPTFLCDRLYRINGWTKPKDYKAYCAKNYGPYATVTRKIGVPFCVLRGKGASAMLNNKTSTHYQSNV